MTTPLHPQTQLLHPSTQPEPGFVGQMQAVHRASTVLFPNSKAFTARHTQPTPYIYGLMGTETSRALEIAMATNDGGTGCILLPSGLAALAAVNLAVLKAGDHVLIGDNGYGPNLAMFQDVLNGLGVSHDVYNPLDTADLTQRLQANTQLVWIESPGSITMEVADVQAIADITHAHGALLAIDHTWSAGVLFKVFDYGVDIAIQALTKYQGGHSDVLMGSVVWRDEALGKRLRKTRDAIGFGVSGDDCALVLRGMQTMHLRLKETGGAALVLAKWLATRPEVAQVLHPALASCPGHSAFARDFTGAASLFSFVLKPQYTADVAHSFVDALQLFGIGASWGGTHSLALCFPQVGRSVMPKPQGCLIRLNIGLEHVEDLRNDLEQAFNKLSG